MPKNVVKKITNTVSKTSKKVNLTYLLAAVIFIGLIITLLVLVMRNKEGFKKFVAFDSMWVSKGEKGADGAKGEDAKIEKSFIDENGNPVTEVLNNDQISTELKNMFMDDMVKDGIIVKEEGTDTNGDKIIKFFSPGIINTEFNISNKEKQIDPVKNDNWFIRNRTFPNKYFPIDYNKKSNNSYVKITYTITLTGHNCQGVQFRIYSAEKINGENITNERQISETHSMAGTWGEDIQRQAPKSITFTGIDTRNDTNFYFVKIRNWTGPGDYRNNYDSIYINKLGIGSYNVDLNSSFSIEEIVLPKDTDTTLSKFIKSNQ